MPDLLTVLANVNYEKSPLLQIQHGATLQPMVCLRIRILKMVLRHQLAKACYRLLLCHAIHQYQNKPYDQNLASLIASRANG